MPCQSCRGPVELRLSEHGFRWEDHPGNLHGCIRRETCVCGGEIRVPAGVDMADVIRQHQAGPGHTAWRLGTQLRRVTGTFQRDGFAVMRVG